VADFNILGSSGLKQYGGYIDEEFLLKLRGSKAVRAYREMSDNCSVVGAVLFDFKMIARKASWYVEPADENDPVQVEAAEFLESCQDDMSHTWNDMMSEIFSMFTYGWAYFEMIYKKRLGNTNNPQTKSKYNDGKIGWRKIALRAQDTLTRWDIDEDGGIKGMYQSAAPTYREVFLPIEKCLLFRTESFKNNPEGKSLLRAVYRDWIFLKGIQELEAIGVEKDAVGIPVLQVPVEFLSDGATSNQATILNNIKKSIAEIRQGERACVVLPSEVDKENMPTGWKLTPFQSGGGKQFNTDIIIRRYESRIAMTLRDEAILLGLEKVGSKGMAGEKIDQLTASIDAFLDDIAAIFNRFALPKLLLMNGYNVAEMPELKHTSVGQISPKELSEIAANLGRGGLLTPDDELENHLRQEAGFPRISEETRQEMNITPKVTPAITTDSGEEVDQEDVE
jgi:hypothetical protein